MLSMFPGQACSIYHEHESTEHDFHVPKHDYHVPEHNFMFMNMTGVPWRILAQLYGLNCIAEIKHANGAIYTHTVLL